MRQSRLITEIIRNAINRLRAVSLLPVDQIELRNWLAVTDGGSAATTHDNLWVSKFRIGRTINAVSFKVIYAGNRIE